MNESSPWSRSRASCFSIPSCVKREPSVSATGGALDCSCASTSALNARLRSCAQSDGDRHSSDESALPRRSSDPPATLLRPSQARHGAATRQLAVQLRSPSSYAIRNAAIAGPPFLHELQTAPSPPRPP